MYQIFWFSYSTHEIWSKLDFCLWCNKCSVNKNAAKWISISSLHRSKNMDTLIQIFASTSIHIFICTHKNVTLHIKDILQKHYPFCTELENLNTTIQSASRLLLYGAVRYAVAINLTCNKIRRVFCMTWYAKIVLWRYYIWNHFPSFYKSKIETQIYDKMSFLGYMNWLRLRQIFVYTLFR